MSWKEKHIDEADDLLITSSYNNGYVFVRPEKNLMKQTRSVRIDLNKFRLNSENRRILRKTEELGFTAIPLPDPTYHWSIGKMAKDFYDTKFGAGTFSANKLKELMTDETKSNFNMMFVYTLNSSVVGYALCYENKDMIHYSYPFYDLSIAEKNKNLGMGMMVRAVKYAEEHHKAHIYLGSAQRPGDTYKFQFEAMEWFDGEEWKQDTSIIKNILKT
ncbi:MAG: GNAT family N-acetyltransferase [Candidatus Magasanikbacteria bacterium]|nr:GNAT family N-acetyltransferase [Candidatus Magasanikbacteria bacterium]